MSTESLPPREPGLSCVYRSVKLAINANNYWKGMLARRSEGDVQRLADGGTRGCVIPKYAREERSGKDNYKNANEKETREQEYEKVVEYEMISGSSDQVRERAVGLGVVV